MRHRLPRHQSSLSHLKRGGSHFITTINQFISRCRCDVPRQYEHLNTTGSYHVTHASAAAANIPVPVPMSLRPPLHEVRLKELIDIKEGFYSQLKNIGNSYEVIDNGPNMADLKRELSWILEDVVAESKEDDINRQWRKCRWQNVEAEHQFGACRDDLLIRLRVDLDELQEILRRRIELREPFQYLLASAHWREYVLSVSQGVLIPRPETEIFPDLVRKALQENSHLACKPWADLGTGSGVIAISTATELRKYNQDAAMVYAVDISPIPLAHAQYNAELAGVSSHIRFALGSWDVPLRAAGLQGQLGGLLSNPPYIPRAQMSGLQQEVQSHEPHLALDGGDGPGLDALQVICKAAVDLLAQGGLIALETAGEEQAKEVRDILMNLTERSTASESKSADVSSKAVSSSVEAKLHISSNLEVERGVFTNVKILKDCFAVPRFVTAHRS